MFSLPLTDASIAKRMQTFRIDVPEYFNFANDVIDAWSQREPEKLAMIWANQRGGEQKLSFRYFSNHSIEAANLLFAHGIRQGDRVILMLPRLPEWWIFSLALIRIGAVQCHLPTLLTAGDLKERIHAANFKAIVSDTGNAEKIDAAMPECPTLTTRILVDGERPGWVSYLEAKQTPGKYSMTELARKAQVRTQSKDLMLLLFTSGTSKSPKLVAHNFAYPLGHRVTAEIWHGLCAQDLHYTATDTGWGKNLWGNYFGQWIVGTCLFIFDIRGKFIPEQVLEMIERYHVTSFCAPPTVYRMLVLLDFSKYDLSSLQSSTSAGEQLHTETWRLWKAKTGLSIREGYGQTETACAIGNPAGIEPLPGSMGIAMPGWNIELLDDAKCPVKSGEAGRIAVNIAKNRPVGLVSSYLLNEADNQAAFQGDYYFTGDKARQDENGLFWYLGRNDDVIKSSGYRIAPQEVEEALMQHRAVQEVAVVGVSDAVRGKKIKAYIVLKPGIPGTEELKKELQTHTKRVTAPYKYPREIEFIDALPKTFSGKIQRHILTAFAETGKWPA